jgi:SAM-dependent methyltransferase
VDAAEHWSRSLADWAIPDQVLTQVSESPWGFPVGTFQHAAHRAMSAALTPTLSRVAEALGEGGSLLDVGCGSGAGSLPVAASTTRIVAVDEDQAMLDALTELAADSTVVERRLGRWPDIAPQVEQADVVVCAHVAYNVADLGPFVAALSRHARRRVVMELTAVHPQSPLSPLWERLWGLRRPTEPNADDAVAVIADELGVEPVVERWRPTERHVHADADNLGWLRRRLCLPVEREEELKAALADFDAAAPPELVTLWWPSTVKHDGPGRPAKERQDHDHAP